MGSVSNSYNWLAFGIFPSPIFFSLFSFFLFLLCQPRAPSELKSLWQGCSRFPLIRNEVYPAPDELNFLCQKPAISKKIMNNAPRIPFQISLWGRGSNCEEIKFSIAFSLSELLGCRWRCGEVCFSLMLCIIFKSQPSHVNPRHNRNNTISVYQTRD